MENETGRYCMGSTEETEEILDFANMVFSMSYGSIDFAALLPKAYAKERRTLPRHHIIKEGHKIRALTDIYPLTLRSGSDRLFAAYIGAVAVHPNSRGKGYMTKLMEKAEEDARGMECALMLLDGNRHRYQHYGYERAGIKYVFCVRLSNIRHCCHSLYEGSYMASPAYSFEEVDGESPYLDEMFSLYMRRNVTARTREDFLLCLQGSQAAAYAVLREGQLAGYISLSADEKSIFEFEADRVSELARILYDFMIGMDIAKLDITAGIDECWKIGHLDNMCDYYNASLSHQIRILDYEKVLTFLLRWKQRYAVLSPGDYIIGVRSASGDSLGSYAISVPGSEARVSRTDREPNVTLGELELVRLLTTSSFFIDQQNKSGRRIKNAPAGWFPLPFYLPDADAF